MAEFEHIEGPFYISHHFPLPKLVFEGTYPETEAEAWQITLQKWRILQEHPWTDDGAMWTCGLCMLFHKRDCTACPVGQAGYLSCRNSPYYRFVNASNAAEAKQAAIEEYQFLFDLYKRIYTDSAESDIEELGT